MSASNLPISNSMAQSQDPTARDPTARDPTSSAVPAFRAFLTRLFDSLRRTFTGRRPWLELVDRSAFSRPTSLSDASIRIRKNISYFRVNYLTVLASVLAFSLISHPFSLFAILCLLAGWLFFYFLRPSDQPLVLFNRTFSKAETLATLVIVTVFVIFLTSVGSLLIRATLIAFGIVCIHGAFRDPEDLFLDDQDLPGSGLFSFVNSAAASAAVAAAPMVASQV